MDKKLQKQADSVLRLALQAMALPKGHKLRKKIARQAATVLQAVTREGYRRTYR